MIQNSWLHIWANGVVVENGDNYYIINHNSLMGCHHYPQQHAVHREEWLRVFTQSSSVSWEPQQESHPAQILPQLHEWTFAEGMRRVGGVDVVVDFNYKFHVLNNFLIIELSMFYLRWLNISFIDD